MADLHGEIRAAIEARCGLARAASDGPWTVHGMSIRGFTHLNHSDCLVVRHTWPQEAAHIVANDPVTVLRHCQEDLRVLERHQQATLGGAPLASHEECRCVAPWPCPEVLSLARRYGIEENDHG